MSDAQFVVLNAIDEDKMLFCSKSILHKDYPGGSKASSEPRPASGTRSVNTFALKVSALSPSSCQLQFINFIGSELLMVSGLPGYTITAYLYFGPLMQRLTDHLVAIQTGGQEEL
jgi:hypothetical protein